jgi:hypothetical protein
VDRFKQENASMDQPRSGYQWTGPEFEIITRDDLSVRQAALMTGRSMAAVQVKRNRLKNEPKLQRVLGAQS